MLFAMRRKRLFRLLVLTALVLYAGIAGAQDVIERAHVLYQTAAYEDALQLLDGYENESSSTSPAAQLQSIDEYRALCLLALNRTDDAHAVLRRLISSNPLYAPSSNDPSPRFLDAVMTVRNEVVPALALQLYADAKAAAERRRYNDASAFLEKLLRIVQQEGIEPSVASSLAPLVHDAKQLFEMSRGGQTVYMAGDPGVTPPAPIKHSLPDPSPLQGAGDYDKSGQLELVIDAAGTVESAVFLTPIHPTYDPLVLKAAKTWTFRPARLNGRAVPFRTVMTVRLTQLDTN